MDLASLIANKPLLTSLSREYELLKATNANINYEDWIVKRLKQAATQQNRLHSAVAGQSAPAASTAAEGKVPAHTHAVAFKQGPNHTNENSLKITLQPGAWSQPHRSRATKGAPDFSKDGAIEFAGEQDTDETPVLRPVLQEWKAQHNANFQPTAQPVHFPLDCNAPAASLWQQPETSVDTAKQRSHKPSSKPQPAWVAAAKLQSSLQSSSVVPLMHAAAERDRRLAATAALVRQQLALRSDSMSTSATAHQQAVLTGRHDMPWGDGDQQQQRLLQQVVNQNQQLLQAVQQQQAVLQRHEGLLSSTAQHSVPAPNSAEPSAASLAAVNTAPAAAAISTQGSQQLPEAIQNSWLVKAALQPNNSNNSVANHNAGQSQQLEFIRITGEAGSKQKLQQQQWPQTKQQQQAAPTDKRSQLKAALRQLLTSSNVSGLPQQQSISGLLQTLLAKQQGTGHGSEQQQKLLEGLAAAVQAIASKQEQRNAFQQHQDENIGIQQPPVQRASGLRSHADATAARLSSRQHLERHRQQYQPAEQQRERPAWQSEPFKPPPTHLLRRKISGIADVWGLPPPPKPKVRPSSAASIGRSARPKSASAPTSKVNSRRVSTAASQQQHQQLQHHVASTAEHRLSSPRNLHHAVWGSADYSSMEGGNAVHTIVQQAQYAGVRPAAGDVGDRQFSMGPDQVQQIELQVQQQLQQEQQHEEEGRLARLEETSAHILGVLGRLEQQLTNPSAAAGAPALASSKAAATSNTAGPSAAASLLQDPLAMSSMLAALDRIEAQEQEIRKRWFSSNEISPSPAVAVAANAGPAATATVLEVRDGVLTAHTSNSATAPSTQPVQQPASVSAHQQPSLQQLQHQAALDLQQPEVLSKEALKSITAGRRRFLRHQLLVDGSLELVDHHTSPEPTIDSLAGAHKARKSAKQLQPTFVVEAVADMLLDELLLSQVEELDEFCDTLCNQLFEAEFEEA